MKVTNAKIMYRFEVTHKELIMIQKGLQKFGKAEYHELADDIMVRQARSIEDLRRIFQAAIECIQTPKDDEE
jgi:hypothetical protein